MPDLLGTAPADLIDRWAPAPDPATRDVAVRRAERIRAGVVSYAAMRQDIADAYAQRDWAALEYDSWHAYLEGEFGDELRQLARIPEQRQPIVGDLRGQGLSVRQIASTTGLPKSTVADKVAQVSDGRTPASVTGADGKTYPAKKAPAAAPTPVGRPDAGGAVPVGPGPQATPEVEPAAPPAMNGPAGPDAQGLGGEPGSDSTGGARKDRPGVDPMEALRGVRGWQHRFGEQLDDLGRLADMDVDEVIEHASDAQMRELVDLHERLGRLVDAVRAARSSG